MNINGIVSFEVEDFDKSKGGFESRQDPRTEAWIVARPYREMGNPNHVFILGTAPSQEEFQEYFTNPLQQAGRTDPGFSVPRV